jgi:hypothetical protein
MAVTITRSTWIDDDGTGTTGTVINQALHTTLYNEIDTALAKVAQLANGNAFVNNQSIAGVLMVNTVSNALNGQIEIRADGAVRNGISLGNTNAANSIYFLAFYNSAAGLAGGVSQSGATAVVYNTTSDQRLKRDAGRAADLTALRALVVHDFTWRADGVRDRGVFAQEAHALYPRAVTPGTDDRMDDETLAQPWMTDYSKFVPDLIVGWQQHDAALAELRALLATVVAG